MLVNEFNEMNIDCVDVLGSKRLRQLYLRMMCSEVFQYLSYDMRLLLLRGSLKVKYGPLNGVQSVVTEFEFARLF